MLKVKEEVGVEWYRERGESRQVVRETQALPLCALPSFHHQRRECGRLLPIYSPTGRTKEEPPRRCPPPIPIQPSDDRAPPHHTPLQYTLTHPSTDDVPALSVDAEPKLGRMLDGRVDDEEVAWAKE